MLNTIRSLAVIVFCVALFFTTGWYNHPLDWLRQILFVLTVLCAAARPSFGILTVLLVLPLSFPLSGWFSYPGFSFVEYVAWGAAAGASLHWLGKNKAAPARSADYWILCFWSVTSLSLVWVLAQLPLNWLADWAPALALALRDLLYGYPQANTLFPLRHWALLTVGVLVYFICRRCLQDELDRRILYFGAQASIILSLLISLAILILVPASTSYRFAGFFGDTNQFAAYVLAVFCAGATLLLTGRLRNGGWIQPAVLLLAALFVPLTFTKLAPFVLLAVVVFLILLFGIKGLYTALPAAWPRQFLRFGLWGILAAAMLVFLAAQFFEPDRQEVTDFSPDLLTNVTNYIKVANIEGLAYYLEHRRFTYWLTSASIIADYPLTGLGAGRYYQLKPGYTPTVDPPYVNFPHENSHCTFLQICAELGFPGLIAFLALCALLLVYGASGLKADSLDADHRILLAATVALFALLLNFLTTDNFLVPQIQIWFWLLAALVTSIGRSDQPKASPALAAPAAVVALVFALALFVTPARQVHLQSDELGLHSPEVSQIFGRFRWTDQFSAWRQRLEGELMLFLLEAQRPEAARTDVDYELRLGAASAAGGRLSWQEIRPVQALVIRGEGADGFLDCSLRASPVFSPFAGKLSPDARRLGLMLRSDFWNYNGLQRAGAYLAGRGRTQLCRPEEIAGRRGYRFADEANIVIDGHLPKLALRLFAPGHLDLHWPYHLHVSVNGAALEPTAIEADNWSETTIPVPGGCSDSLIKIRITAYSPHFWNPASLSAPRGFVVGISDQL